MLTDSLLAAYQQYKQDTKHIVEWLACTARSYGFRATQPASEGRLKGKARKEAKKTTKLYPVSLSDFEPMALFLVEKFQVTVPSFFAAALARAIRRRMSFADELKRSRDLRIAFGAGDTHQHFVDVLQRVHEILKPRMGREASLVFDRISTSGSTVDSMPDLTNRFGGLHVSEPSEAFLNAPNVSVPERMSQDLEETVVFEPWKDDLEEALFVWRTLNVGLQRLRRCVAELWERYRTGDLGLAGVAIAHNTAIHLARRMGEELATIFEKYGGFQEIIHDSFIVEYVNGATDHQEQVARLKRANSPTLDLLVEQFDLADQQMFFAYQCIVSEAATTATNCYSTYHGKFGWYLPNDDRAQKTNREKYNEDHGITSELVGDLQLVEMLFRVSNLVPDEFAAVVGEIARTPRTTPMPRVSLRAIFATQLALDCLRILGKNSERPYHDFMATNTIIAKSTQALSEFYTEKGSRARGPLKPEHTQAALRWAKIWHGQDPIATQRRELGDRRDIKEHLVLKYSPLLSGWWMQYVRFEWNWEGVAVANSISLPLFCARLYYAFVQEKLLSKESWPDMDALCILQRGAMWAGNAPRSGEYIKNLMLCGGHSVTQLASNPRTHSRHHTGRARKMLSHRAPVSAQVHNAFVGRKTAGLEERDIPGLVKDSKVRWYNGVPKLPCPQHGWKEEKHSAASEKDMSRDLLWQLALAIDAEEVEQSFDYMTLHRVCCKLLQELFDKGGPILDKVLSESGHSIPWETVEGSNLRQVVGHIFLHLFLPDGTVRKEAGDIAEIIKSIIDVDGRAVHDTTGRNWAWDLRCTCEGDDS